MPSEPHVEQKRYWTDLSDKDWESIQPILRRSSDPSLPGADLRQVVNAIRYKEKSGCGWDLLPHDLPNSAIASPYADLWKSNGTWEKISKTLDPKAKLQLLLLSVADRLRRVKRVAGRGIRKLPHSERAVNVIQAVYRFLRPIFLKSTAPIIPFSRYRILLDRAERAERKQKFERALHYIEKCAAIYPLLPQVYLLRCQELQKLERHREACEECWRGLVLPNNAATKAQFHSALARSLARLGQVEEGFQHYCQASLPGWSGMTSSGRPRIDHNSTIQTFGSYIAAHSNYAEDCINSNCDFQSVKQLYQKRARLQEAFARKYNASQFNLCILTDDYVRNIGHMACIDFWIKQSKMGWNSSKNILLIAPQTSTANRWYLKYWRDHVDVISDPGLIAGLSPLFDGLGNRVAGQLTLPSGVIKYSLEGFGDVQEAWEEKGNAPLLSLTPKDRRFGESMLRRMGVPPDAWFVAVHARAPGFYLEWRNDHQSHRNAAIHSFVPAMQEIVRQGGWVIRMGDESMEPLSPLPGVIDYAHSQFKSQRMDIFLCGACRFFIGVASGLSHVPTTFGVPCVLVNWISNALPVYSRHDLFLPKLLRSEREGRRLPFHELLGDPVRRWCYSGLRLTENGLRVIDNSPEEIHEVVIEMLSRLEGRFPVTPEDEDRQTAFRSRAASHGLSGFSRIGTAFLRRNADLL
jgi:putative glycosyltransferase (TIGR04372 family)